MEQKKLPSGFSIIICAYNAEKKLEKTLYYISCLNVPGNLDIELILVDNNSTDKTQELAQATWNQLGQPFPLHVVEESNPGLSNARRRGVLIAQYRYGIFCDDDNWLDENYLIYAREIFESNPHVGVIGGCSIPVSEVELPPWFYTKCHFYAVGVQADSDGDITWRKFVWGAGMCFLVSPLKEIYLSGIFHLSSDRKGADLTSGGDSEISAWFILLDFRLYYSNNLIYKHFMPEERLTDEYYSRLAAGLKSTKDYNSYLTVKKNLAIKVRNKNSALLFVANYFFSILRLFRFFSDTIQIFGLDRKLRRIRKAILSKN